MLSAVSRKIGSARSFFIFLPYITVLLIYSASVHAQESKSISRATVANLETIRAILELPDEQIDLGSVKLSVDQMVDPSIDTASNLKQIDIMVSEIKARIPAHASSRDKLEVLRNYLYKAGPWNGYKPFQYDLVDPLGRKLKNKLLPTYLTTRKGNCVSMPILFVVLGQKIGLDVTLSTAPEHLFVKYRDEVGKSYNLETTSGAGFTRDEWIRRQLPMTDRALASGLYMTPLNRKESVAIIVEILLEHYRQHNLEEQRISLANLALKYYAKNITAMLHICSASHRLREKLFVNRYKSPSDIPALERPYFVKLGENYTYWREKAYALGWKEFDKSTDGSSMKNTD